MADDAIIIRRTYLDTIGSLPTAMRGIKTGKMRSLAKLIPGVHPKLPGGAQDEVKAIYQHAEEHNEELNLYIRGEEGDDVQPDGTAAEEVTNG